MKNLTLRKNIPTLDFKKSKLSRKDINTINKFKSLVINNGDDGLREISKMLKEKSLKSFKVTKSEYRNLILTVEVCQFLSRNNWHTCPVNLKSVFSISLLLFASLP